MHICFSMTYDLIMTPSNLFFYISLVLHTTLFSYTTFFWSTLSHSIAEAIFSYRRTCLFHFHGIHSEKKLFTPGEKIHSFFRFRIENFRNLYSCLPPPLNSASPHWATPWAHFSKKCIFL